MTRGLCAALLAFGAGLLVACSTPTTTPATARPADDANDVPPVGDVALETRSSASALPDLAVVIFADAQASAGGAPPAFPTVRKAETLLMPVRLAQTLRDSGGFGVVRVVPDAEVKLPLRLSGEILRADATRLDVRLTLRGADEQVLLERRYRDVASADDYPVATGAEPFGDLYRAVSNDVLAVLEALPEATLDELSRLALMRFGASLAPSGFARYVDDAGGSLRLKAFPADDDPMLARLERLRRQDELFIDAVDEQYTQLYDTVGESYALWRSYVYELETYGAAYRESAAQRDRDARRGSFASMQQVYATYRKVKLQEEDLRDVVRGFDGEALDTVMQVDDGVVRLSGSVDERYRQWRAILTKIYALETGLPPAGS